MDISSIAAVHDRGDHIGCISLMVFISYTVSIVNLRLAPDDFYGLFKTQFT